jgi:heat shock protein HslJ
MKPTYRATHRALFVAGACLMACLHNPLAAAGLEGTDWQIAQYRTDSGLADAAPAVLRFEDGRLSGSAGCNRLLGGYSLDGDKLSVAPNMASTMMACPPPLMAQDQFVTKALGQVAGYALGADGLMLLDAAGKPLLTFTELEATPLTGTTWRLTHFNNGKGAVTTVVQGTEIVLRLSDDGQFGGKACNSYRGGYVVEDGVFALEGPIAATRMACPGPEGAGEQEAAYFAALERAAAYRISGDELTLSDADGSTLARFRAAARGE